jgi:transcriptional regulator with XRE-family HTH domain
MEESAFGGLLRDWRRARRMSQQVLGEEAEVSTRHISFLETGKATPSRSMVLVLASALDLPLRERNHLLQAAGFVPAYRATSWQDDDAGVLRRTLSLILRHHGSIPAMGVTPVWDVVEMNAAALRLFAAFLPAQIDPIVTTNVIDALFHPDGVRRFVVNWEEVASAVLERVHHEASLELDRRASETLLSRLSGYPDLPPRRGIDAAPPDAEVSLPLHLKREDLELRLFTTITTLGTPVDVSAQELRIEAYYPADASSEAWLVGEA